MNNQSQNIPARRIDTNDYKSGTLTAGADSTLIASSILNRISYLSIENMSIGDGILWIKFSDDSTWSPVRSGRVKEFNSIAINYIQVKATVADVDYEVDMLGEEIS